MEDNLRGFFRQLIAELDDAPTADAAEQCSQHIPVHGICQLLGVPESDGDMLREWILRNFHLAPRDNAIRMKLRWRCSNTRRACFGCEKCCGSMPRDDGPQGNLAMSRLRGCPIRAGQQMLRTFPAANHDSDSFENAHEFQLDRAVNRKPTTWANGQVRGPRDIPVVLNR